MNAGHQRNWLVFGERSAAHDGFHTGELQAWRENGSLQRLELVYSRDQPQRRYVQEALVEAAAEVRQWVAEGAAIYVCGSLRGMAPGVDAALERILGRSEEHTSELQSLMRISYAVFCLKKNTYKLRQQSSD